MLLSFATAGLSYDPPNFGVKVFSSDGLFLEENEEDTLMAALTAVACNFKESRLVDSDLREKAIAIALQLNPLHSGARKAHEALMSGDFPDQTGMFDSATTVANQLWNSGTKLLEGNPEPEEAKLAPYLLDLALTMHPSPPLESLQRFSNLTDGKALPWNRFVSLQESSNVSTKRVRELLSNMGSKPAPPSPGKKGPKGMNPFSEKLPAPKKGGPSDRDNGPRSEIALSQVTVPTLGRLVTDESASVGNYVAGKLLVVARDANASEVEQFGSFRGGDGGTTTRPFEMRLQRASDAAAVFESFREIFRYSRRENPRWPFQKMADFTFRPSEEISTEDFRVKSSVAGVTAVNSIFSGREPEPDFAISGEFAPDTRSEAREKFRVSEDLWEGLSKMTALPGIRFHALPADNYPAFLEKLSETNELKKILKPQLISFQNLSELTSLQSEPNRKQMEAAAAAFDEIGDVLARMPAQELASNVKVQERLKGIVDAFPNHMSARLMMAYGKSVAEQSGDSSTGVPVPKDQAELVTQALDSIDELILPYAELGTESPFDLDLNLLKSEADAADQALVKMRSSVPQAARAYVSKAEDLLEIATEFLGLTNKTTSTARQKAREIEAKSEEMKGLRARITSQ